MTGSKQCEDCSKLFGGLIRFGDEKAVTEVYKVTGDSPLDGSRVVCQFASSQYDDVRQIISNDYLIATGLRVSNGFHFAFTV